jgi:hypothetical protein
MTDSPPPTDPPEANNAAGAGCMARLVRHYPLPWSVDHFPHPYVEKSKATIYAGDSTQIATFRGDCASDLANLIIELVLQSLPKTEESYHAEPPEGCICGFMAQVTAPDCPVCLPNTKHIHPEPNTKDETNQ